MDPSPFLPNFKKSMKKAVPLLKAFNSASRKLLSPSTRVSWKDTIIGKTSGNKMILFTFRLVMKMGVFRYSITKKVSYFFTRFYCWSIWEQDHLSRIVHVTHESNLESLHAPFHILFKLVLREVSLSLSATFYNKQYKLITKIFPLDFFWRGGG